YPSAPQTHHPTHPPANRVPPEPSFPLQSTSAPSPCSSPKTDSSAFSAKTSARTSHHPYPCTCCLSTRSKAPPPPHRYKVSSPSRYPSCNRPATRPAPWHGAPPATPSTPPCSSHTT